VIPRQAIKSLRKIVFGSLIAMSLCVAPLAAAQEGHGEGEGPKKSLFDLFKTTGVVGYLLVGCSIAGTTLVIEHIVSLPREKLAPTVLADELTVLINEEKYEEAVELADEEGGPLAALIGSALRMRDAGYDEMIVRLEADSNEEAFKLNTKISYLSLIGNVAPLLGLLGTVTGMISSFQTIETLKSPTPGDLAKGVYESLVNTTMGLFVAIVFLTIYFLFKNKVSKLVLSINLQAVDMLAPFALKKRHAA